MANLAEPKLNLGWIIAAIFGVIVLVVFVIPAGLFASGWLATTISNLTGGKINIKTIGK